MAILNELEGWIRGGRLEPGHRLPSIKAIQKMLKVGQRSVESAVESLAKRGLVETRNRSGNYLKVNAREILASENSRALQSSWVLDHYLPRSSKHTLTVFTTDCVGRMKGVWNQVIRTYEGKNDLQIRLLTPNDGHLIELMKLHDVDVIHSTPEMLQAIGWDKLNEIAPIQGFDEFSEDLLPQVRARMNVNLSRRALPFAITVMYLFLNRSMASKFDLPLDLPSTPLDFLAMVKKAHATLKLSGLNGFLIPSIADILLISGGLVFSPEGQVVFDRDLSRQCLAEIAGSKLLLPNPAEIPNAFAAGETLTMRHCSFTCSELLEQVHFDWVAKPVPLAIGSQDLAWLTLLAVPQSSQSPKEAFRFIECLLSRESQANFAAIGGNLPVRRSALSSVAEADVNHVLPETIHRALAQSELSWPHFVWEKFLAKELHAAAVDLVSGRVGPDVLLQEIQGIVKQISAKF
jgi:ABC-type glycerol-3-phosphate transport system substrate-binding protein/DNA-binding transcriptional regulator YhcF (GntR family)